MVVVARVAEGELNHRHPRLAKGASASIRFPRATAVVDAKNLATAEEEGAAMVQAAVPDWTEEDPSRMGAHNPYRRLPSPHYLHLRFSEDETAQTPTRGRRNPVH